MKGIFNKEFRSKLEVKDKKIYSYINESRLDIDKVIKDYTNYIYTTIKKSYAQFSKEDMEEIVSDVFLIVWNNQNKLNINNNMSSYIRGITKNLLKQKYRYIKVVDNIVDYEEELVSLSNIELDVLENEENMIILEEIEKMKLEDKDIFILYYYDNRSIKEICAIHNMSEVKVKSKLFRIRKRLRKALGKRGYGSNE